ncbi:MAG: hypothetical protein KJZ60_02185, partial [Ignavibacteriaceae bacterium]|nr:hypothetical protein [Ignavibacteriaceae bacterium]
MKENIFRFFTNSSFKLLSILAAFSFSNLNLHGQVINYSDGWGSQGFSIETENVTGVKLNFSIHQFEMQEVTVNGTSMKSVHIPGVFLPNDEGAPDLAGTSRFIMIPEGARASFNITATRTESFENVEVAPAFRIPKGNEDGPLSYIKDERIYAS